MLHKILTAVEKNNKKNAMAVLVNMVDWSQAFDRQSHFLGIKAFVESGVRESLIPVLKSFFQNRRMKVKWNGECTKEYKLNGGSPQGDIMGILEFLAQTNKNADFLNEDERFKFIDDLSFLEILNLAVLGLTLYDFQTHVPSDIGVQNKFLPATSFESQRYLDNLSEWTKNQQMKLNPDKSKYLIVNFTHNYQFSIVIID